MLVQFSFYIQQKRDTFKVKDRMFARAKGFSVRCFCKWRTEISHCSLEVNKASV